MMSLLFMFSANLVFAQAKPPKNKVYTSKYGYRTVLVTGGQFIMSEGGASTDERARSVTLNHNFFMGETEVTLSFWKKVMIGDPSLRYGTQCARVGVEDYPDGNSPVYCVSWFEVARMANQLSVWEGFEPCYEFSDTRLISAKSSSCTGYRLPTEAEWEYAARAVPTRKNPKAERETLQAKAELNPKDKERLKILLIEEKRYLENQNQKPYPFSGGKDPTKVAWFSENSDQMPQMVALQSPNVWGLYDMSGNVWEWCHDWYTPYATGDVDPSGPSGGTKKSLRGGGFMSDRFAIRSVNRFQRYPEERGNQIGFRLVRTAPKIPKGSKKGPTTPNEKKQNVDRKNK